MTEHEAPFQLRVLPAAHTRRRRKAAHGPAPARAALAGVLLGHVRRGRLDARGHAGDGARDLAARACPRRRISRVSAARARTSATYSRSIAPTASVIWWHCAATCRRAPSTPASSATRASSSRSSARSPATGFTSTSPHIRNITRRRARPDDDLANFKRKVDAGANSAITQYFFNARRVLALRRRVRRGAASAFRSCPASCRSPATRSWRASPTRAARKSRAGSGASSRATATNGVDPRVRPRRRHAICARTARRRRARGCTSTR